MSEVFGKFKFNLIFRWNSKAIWFSSKYGLLKHSLIENRGIERRLENVAYSSNWSLCHFGIPERSNVPAKIIPFVLYFPLCTVYNQSNSTNELFPIFLFFFRREKKETFCENYITAIKSLPLLFIFHVNEFSLNYSTIESYAMWFYLKVIQLQIVTKQTKNWCFCPFKMRFIYIFVRIAHFWSFVCCLVGWLVWVNE